MVYPSSPLFFYGTGVSVRNFMIPVHIASYCYQITSLFGYRGSGLL